MIAATPKQIQHRGVRADRRQPVPRSPATTRSRRSRSTSTRVLLNVRRFLDRATSGRRGTRCGSRRWSTTFPTTIPSRPASEPFSVTTEVAACPWNASTGWCCIGLQGPARSHASERPPSNLVFLIDVSGSMQPAEQAAAGEEGAAAARRSARPQDRVAIVVYAGSAGLVLPSTPGGEQGEDPRARSSSLEAGGSTNGGAGDPARLRTSPRRTSSRAASTASSSAPTAISTSASPSDGELVRLIEEKREERRLPHASSASAPATSRTRRWSSSPTRATATTPTSTRCTRRRRSSSSR